MLSRLTTSVATAGVRRAVTASRLKPTTIKALGANAPFHAGPVRQSEDDKLKPAGISMDGPLIRYGLNDWRLSLPVGLALAVPFLANEWLILSEETQLVACFVGFSTTVVKYAGGSIGKYFDDQQTAIIEEINRLEELEQRLYKETIEAAKLEKTIIEDLTFLDAKSAEVADKLEATLNNEIKHKIRDQFVRWLDSVVASEKSTKKAQIDTFLASTAAAVSKSFATDAKLKKAAVDQVLSMLKDPKAAPADLVSAEFEKSGKKIWEETFKKGEAASKESISTLTSQLKALKSKDSLSEADIDNAVKLYYSAFKGGASASSLKL